MSNYRRYFKNNNPVFVTCVTKNRKDLLIKNIEILRNSFKFAKTKYRYEIVAAVILKEHFHCILSAENQTDIPEIIRVIKFNFSKNIPVEYLKNIEMSNSAIKRGEKGIWQRRYYDHIIRNESDMQKHIDYIHYNPTKHYNIAPKNWEYSSFKKFVKIGLYNLDWCNYGDKNQIISLDYE
jgi:putative transposase